MDRELDREIKNLSRRIRKNDELRKQCRISANSIDIDDDITSSSMRASELRGTAQALAEENEMLSYKLKLRSRLRERVRFMRQAADATWRACGGRGKTRELALALAKVTALQEECAELQNSHLEALQEGMRSQVSTSELAQELATTKALLEKQRQDCYAKDEEIRKLRAENASCLARIATLEDTAVKRAREVSNLKDSARKSRASEEVLRQSVNEHQVKTARLQQSLATAKIEAENSRERETRLRAHVAATSPRSYIDPTLLAQSLYGPVGSNIDTLYGNPYLSETAKRLAFDSAATLRDYQIRHLAATSKLKEIDEEMEVASAVERDVDAIRRARDRQNLALLRAEADLGILSSNEL